MNETRTPEEVAELLCSSYEHALSGIIAIDGKDGVGKTTLANALHRIIGGKIVSLDDFLIKNRGGYVPNLQQNKLRAALRVDNQPKIVEGVCVLAALDSIGCKPDVLIYVKKIIGDFYWHDEETCDPTEPVEELITRLADQAARLAIADAELSCEPTPAEKPTLTPLKEEIIRYHDQYRPSRKASIIFLHSH